MYSLIDFPKEALDKVITHIYNVFKAEEREYIDLKINTKQLQHLSELPEYSMDAYGLKYKGINITYVVE